MNMTISILILFILVGVGITNLVVNASILDYPREILFKFSRFLEKLISCMTCSGFWVGFILSFWFSINPIFGGAIISLCSAVFDNLLFLIHVSSEAKITEIQMYQQEEINPDYDGDIEDDEEYEN